MTIKPKACTHCGGDLIFDDEDREWKCFQCGRSREASDELHNTKDTYYDQHRDEILADRLSIGHGATLVKWKIPAGDWIKFKYQCEQDGIEVPNLTNMRSARAREAKGHTAKVLAEELAKGNIPPTPTVREEKAEPPAELKQEFLKDSDKVWIAVGLTVEQIEEKLRELEYLKGYKQAVLDILSSDKS